jgi:pyruvate/2-oxoglutarate dehydrogenase complex dihydrolipoamide acyltransferase (E2) component
VQVAGGILLAVGKFRRPAAIALIGSIIPTTYAGHRFWEELDPASRAQQKMHFLKNVGLLGGLILAAFDTEGEPSLAWRTKRQARQLESTFAARRASGRREVRRAQRAVGPSVTQASKEAIRSGRAASRGARRRARAAGQDLQDKVTVDPETLTHAHDVVTDVVKSSTDAAGHAVEQAASFVSDAAKQLEPLARNTSHPKLGAVAPYVTAGAERTTEALSKLREHMPVD